ncbi:MAG TPA: class I SAM-dependent methyltransferase [Paenalcaligenes sp.]|nr:class I SAM-dependent methyltransferase [Paenalcaligenes sp.]
MRAVYFSVGVISAVFIALQLNLVRMLSTLLSYHFVFSVVSLAMLGLGLGGLIVQRLQAHYVHKDKALLGYLWSCLISTVLALVLVVWMAQKSIFFEHYYAYFLVMLIPFTFGGAFFAQAYQGYSSYGSQLYAADLFGAALGCVLGVLLLNWLGALRGILILAAVLAFVLWYLSREQGRVSWAAVLVGVGCLFFGGVPLQIGINWSMTAERNPDKEISDALTGPLAGEVARHNWSAFGLTEQVDYQNTNEHRDIYVDGTAGTPMYAFTGDFERPGVAVQNLLRFFPGALPFQVMKPENKNRALVIGPGGGRDILLAAESGFELVRGVEVNPDLLAMVKAQSDYNGGLYTDFESIDIQQAEGRHFVQRDSDEYNLIMLSLPVTNTSRSPEGFALTENFLLTTEAIEDYLEHLTENGLLMVITHDELAVLRLIMTALEAYKASGLDVQQVFQRMYVLGSFPYPIVVFGKEPFELETSQQLLQQSMQRNYSMNASYFPQLHRPGMGNPMLQALATGNASVAEVQAHIKNIGHDITSISDDRPFFYHFDIQPPKILLRLFYVALAASILVWLWSGIVGFRGQATATKVRLPAMSTAFLGLGAGFMLLEIVFVQKLTFYLGNPVIALALLLALLLLGMAVGSRLTALIKSSKLHRCALRSALLVCAVGLAYQWLLPDLLSVSLLWPLILRVLFASALLLPIGIALGLCFPLLIRLLSKQERARYIPWMWAINGFSSVLGASAAVLGALIFGFQKTLWLGLLCYALVAFSIYLMRVHSDSNTLASKSSKTEN